MTAGATEREGLRVNGLELSYASVALASDSHAERAGFER